MMAPTGHISGDIQQVALVETTGRGGGQTSICASDSSDGPGKQALDMCIMCITLSFTGMKAAFRCASKSWPLELSACCRTCSAASSDANVNSDRECMADVDTNRSILCTVVRGCSGPVQTHSTVPQAKRCYIHALGYEDVPP